MRNLANRGGERAGTLHVRSDNRGGERLCTLLLAVLVQMGDFGAWRYTIFGIFRHIVLIGRKHKIRYDPIFMYITYNNATYCQVLLYMGVTGVRTYFSFSRTTVYGSSCTHITTHCTHGCQGKWGVVEYILEHNLGGVNIPA